MHMTIARYLLLCLIVVIPGGNAWCGSVSRKPVQVCVLFFNDLHGHLTPFEIEKEGAHTEVGGIARMAALIRDIRSENTRNRVTTLVLVAGDILQGTPLSTVFKGEPDIKCLNLIGVSAMTVGNHEFDFGIENFLKLKKEAAFPFLSVNIMDEKKSRLLCDSHKTILLEGRLSITVIGVTTPELKSTTRRENVASLRLFDPVRSVKALHDYVKDRGPVILLSHSRHLTDRAIAESIPDLSAIIGGHDQILLSPYRLVNGVPIFQAFEKGRYLGRIDFSIDPETKKARLIHHAYLPVTAAIVPDQKTDAIVHSYQERLGVQFKTVIGSSETFLDGERGRIRYEETNLGNFITDIMVEHTGAAVGLLNAGAIRSSIKKGPVTVEDVFKAMPYENELVLMDLTGGEIKTALERAVRGSREEEDGGFLHVSGIFADVKDHRIDAIRMKDNKTLLDPNGVYRVVLPDFLASGGDGHGVFQNRPFQKTGLPLRELIVDTITERKKISGGEEGRIRRLK